MAVVLPNASRMKPEVRLAQAVSQFEADLSNEQKTAFRALRSLSLKTPPDPSDVMRLTAEIDRRMSKKSGGRCFGPRFTNFLQGVQQFATIGDVVLGSSQNMIACGVWSLVRMSLLIVVNLSPYVEKFSTLFMDIGRLTPRYQTIALLYPRSNTLQSHLSEYYVVVVQLCHQLLKFTQKSTVRQVASASTLSDSEINIFQSKLDLWANSIKEEMNLLLVKRAEEEAQKSSQLRSPSNKNSKSASASYLQTLATNMRVLDFCSKYDHETSWKQTRKVGNAALFGQVAEYQEWKDCSSSCTLSLTGKLGSGKSVLLANVVDDINIHIGNKKTAVAYFFCRHDIPESLKARTVLGSLARQLLRTIPDLAMVAEVCDETSSTEDTEKLFRLLHRALPSGYKAYFILDGLDECDHSEREILAQELKKLQETLKLLLCISSRVEPDDGLESIAERFTAVQVISIPDDNPDIEAFIEAELERCLECQKLVVGDPTLILDIHDALLKGSQGTFLWVALQIQFLCGMRTDQELRDALLDLPKDLPETFSRILRQSEGSGQSYQTQILQLITSAYRPLTANELREALSVVPGDTVWNPSRLLNNVYSALNFCGSLLTVDEEESTVRFVHHSVKQFVLNGFSDSNNTAFTAKGAQRIMADIVVTYLNYGVFEPKPSKARVPQARTPSPQSGIAHASIATLSTVQIVALKMLKSKKRLSIDNSKTLAEARKPVQSGPSKEFCFHSYAKLHWLKHIVCLSERSPIVDSLLPSILKGTTVDTSTSNEDCSSLLWLAAQAGHQETVKLIIEGGKIDEILGDKSGLQQLYLWANDNGHDAIVQLLVSKGADVSAQDGQFDKALQAASYQNDEQVVELPVGKGTGFNARGGVYGNALPAATYRGYEQVVKQLVGKGADVSVQGGKSGNTLQAASYQSIEQVAKLLVTKGADVNAHGGVYGNALQAASPQTNEQVVKPLVTKGADVNAQGGVYGNAPQAASPQTNEQAVKLLDGEGADVNAQGGQSGDALQAASYQNNEQAVKLVDGKGADVSAGGQPGNALQAASCQSIEQVAKLLVSKGADISAGGQSGNALQAASPQNNEHVVKPLISNGADVSAGGQSGNALQAASYQSIEQVAKLLVSKGADISAGGQSDNTLQAASYENNEHVVKQPISKDVNVGAQGEQSGNALQAASYQNNEQVVKPLVGKGADVGVQVGPVGKGADVGIQVGKSGNALQAALYQNNEQVVKLLVGKGADVSAQGGQFGNALQAAAYQNNEQVVKLLLEKGADVNAQGGHYGNALYAASYQNNQQVVKLLLDKGANVNAQGGIYGNALYAAAYQNNEQVVKLLLDKGANVNAQGGKYGNALQAASDKGHAQIVKLLINKGANVNAQGGKYGNALQAASYQSNEQVVKLLLDKDVNVNAQGGVYSNALQAASYQNNEQVVKLLLDKGAAVNAQGGVYGNALQAASYRGFEQVVKLLLDNSADVNAQGGHYGNALQAASVKGHGQIVKLLLDNGAQFIRNSLVK